MTNKNILIVYYSHTGHTKKVVNYLTSDLNDAYDVQAIQLVTVGRLDFKAEVFPIEKLPEIQPFDVLILGSPVHGGRISAPIRTYLSHVNIYEKPVILLLTHFFREGWGTNQAADSAKKLIEEKGAIYMGKANVKWLSFQRTAHIKRAISRITNLIDDLRQLKTLG